LEPRHHCIISGTGRTGTSFIIQLLSYLGKDTGYASDPTERLDSIAKAGLEYDIRKRKAPYIVKNPRICLYIEEVLRDPSIVIDHAFIPMRSLDAAARSRAVVHETALTKDRVKGGLWLTKNADEQANILACLFHQLVWSLERAEIPITLLTYPRLTYDSDYLYKKLSPLVSDVDPHRFEEAFNKVRRPDWVHTLGPDDR
jgi:hypothetical protein